MNSEISANLDFQSLFESAPGLYLVLARDLQIVALSHAYLQGTMTSREAILGRGIFDVFPDNPDDPGADGVRNLRASLERVLETKEADAMAVQKYDIRRPEAEGGGFEERFWSPVNTPVLGPNGQIRYIIHRVEDVTEFIRLKQAGQEREQMAAALLNRSEQMDAEIYRRAQEVSSANRRLVASNEKLAALYDDITRLMRRADQELGSAENLKESMTSEEMLSTIGRLITDHKHLEEQLRQSQKMEAIGRLAGGVAHDFNNLLTVIIGHATLLEQQLSGQPAATDAQEIERCAQRAATLTRQLLAFSRKQVLQPKIVDVNSVVSGMEDLLRRLIGENIAMLTVLGSGLDTVKADPSQLELVIMNLAVNARDAMPRGGRLTIETSGAKVPQGQINTLNAGQYVVLSVSDTGHGIDAGTTARIFEPFFTTKDKGKGTGLGLSTAYGIAQQSGGTILVDSQPGAGATFRVYLPAAMGAREIQEVAQPAPVSTAAARGTILVVEDQAVLRELLCSILEHAGYSVLQAANGEEALAKSANSAMIDAVLTDVLMPVMSGPDLVNSLRAARIPVKVLFMSGYDEDMLRKFNFGETAQFLQKPFTPKALLKKLSELLALKIESSGSQTATG